MDDIRHWFDRQAARERRTIVLEDALLGGRFSRYFAYRLRFFGLRWAIAAVLQLAKVVILRDLFSSDAFVSIVGAVAVASLVGSTWWGALEVLRGRVRRLYRTASPARTSREIGLWVRRSLWLSAGIVVAAIVGLGVSVAISGRLEPLALALAAVAARAALDLPIRAYHAGAYAIRRVYRPVSAILVLEALSVGALVVLSQVLGAYAVAAAELLVAAAFAVVSVGYVRRTHRLLGLRPLAVVRRRRGAVLRRADLLHSIRTIGPLIQPSLAGLAMGVDALVVLGAAAAVSGRPGSTWLALLFAASAPTIRAACDWPRLTYFDLARLQPMGLASFRRRVDRATIRLAAVLGLGFAMVVWAVGWFALHLTTLPLVALAGLLVAISLLGVAQMEAFTAGAYRRAVLGGAMLVAGFATLRPVADRGVEPVAWMAIVALGAGVAVRLTARLAVGGPPEGEPLLPTAWLSRLRAIDAPVRIGAAQVRLDGRDAWAAMAQETGTAGWRARLLARRLAARAGRGGGVAWVAPDTIVWWSPATGGIDRRRVLMESAGRLRDLRESPVLANGRAAVATVARWDVLRVGRKAPPVGIDAVIAAARSTLTNPEIVRLDSPSHGDMSTADRRTAVWHAMRHARDLSEHPAGHGIDVTTWCPLGSIDLVIVDRASGGRARRRWRSWLRAANLSAAAAGLLTGQSILDTSARGAMPAALAAPKAATSE